MKRLPKEAVIESRQFGVFLFSAYYGAVDATFGVHFFLKLATRGIILFGCRFFNDAAKKNTCCALIGSPAEKCPDVKRQATAI